VQELRLGDLNFSTETLAPQLCCYHLTSKSEYTHLPGFFLHFWNYRKYLYWLEFTRKK